MSTAVSQIDNLLNTEPPPNGGILHVANDSGDIRQSWDKGKPDEVEAARGLFNKFARPASQGGKGYSAFYVKPGADGEKGRMMREFDPDAERIILMPPLVGG